MKQILKGIIDTQKMNYVPLGLVNISDTVLMDLDIRQNGEEVALTNPTIELLARKQDGNKVRQLENIKYSNGKIAIDVDPEILTFKGSVACQIVIKENEERVSTCLFNFDVNGTIDSGIIIESKEKIKTLDDLQELIDIGFEDLNEYSRRLAELENEMLGTNSTINQNEVERNKSEQDRKTTFEGLKENYKDFKVEKDKEFEELKNDYQGFKGQKDEEFTELKIEMVEATNEVIETNLEATANESKRVEAEAKRVVDFNKTMDTAEATNKKLEATNTSINLEESKRVTSETSRKQAETTRVNAETSRTTTFNTLKTNMETATSTSITEEGKRATTFNTLKTDMLNTEAQLKATDEQLTANEELREAEWEVLKKEPTTARKDYFNKTHNTLQERLNSDFDNVHQRVNDSSLIEYSGTNISAKNSYYGLTKEHSISGRTLQNLASLYLIGNSSYGTLEITSDGYHKVTCTANGDIQYNLFKQANNLFKPNTKYTFICFVRTNTVGGNFRCNTFDNAIFSSANVTFAKTGEVGTILSIGTSQPNITNFNIPIKISNCTVGQVLEYKIMFLEGDHTNTPLSELPYFEGIASVGDLENGQYKVSAKSCGKNLFDGSFSNINFNTSSGLVTTATDNCRSVIFKVKKGKIYKVSGIDRIVPLLNASTIRCLQCYQKPVPTIPYTRLPNITASANTITATEDGYIYLTHLKPDDTFWDNDIWNNVTSNYQIEEVPTSSTTSTPYAPYVEDTKAYYLAEPLRSLPNGTKDEIVGSTLIRRVGKVTFSGNENIGISSSINSQLVNCMCFTYALVPYAKSYTNILSDKFVTLGGNQDVPHVRSSYSTIEIGDIGTVLFYIEKSKLSTQDVNGFKAWLQANHVTIYYELATPIVTQLGEHLALQTFAETTHIMSDNYMLPTQKCKVPTNVQAVISTLMIENENLNNEVNTLNLENEELASTNEIQDELINVSLCATDEMYMMIEPLLSTMPMAFSINNDVERGSNSMVDMYVAMVMRGLKTIEEVPLRYRAEVKQILEDLEK